MFERQLTMREFHAELQRLGPKDIIVDVRDPEEYRQGHIRGARNLPLEEVVRHVAELKTYGRVFVHCRRGGRATRACEMLRDAGLANMVCLCDWGMEAWIDAGYPVER